VIEYERDFDGKDHNGEPFFYFWYRVTLYRGAEIICEADGQCNSHESKYRWRWVSVGEIPPGLDKATLKTRPGTMTEFAFAVDKGETGGRYGKPAEYWQAFRDAIANKTAVKTTRAFKSGKESPAWQIDTTLYRVPSDEIADIANTVQKMAFKRALVAAVRLGANASEFFSEDAEPDGNGHDDTREDETTEPAAKPAAHKMEPKERAAALNDIGMGEEPRDVTPTTPADALAAFPAGEPPIQQAEETKPADAKALFYERATAAIAAKQIKPVGINEIAKQFGDNWSGALDWLNQVCPMPAKAA
jgi:hypothetical protein